MGLTLEQQGLSREQMVSAFNEWMRQYTESPEAFERKFQAVAKFLADGEKPTYGDECAELMFRLVESLGIDHNGGGNVRPPAPESRQ
jgi:hypothetical protein